MEPTEHQTERAEQQLLAQLRQQGKAQLRCLNEPGVGDKIDAFMDTTKRRPVIIAGPTY